MSSHDLQFSIDGGDQPASYSGPMDGTSNGNGSGAPASSSSSMAALVQQSAHPTVCLFHVLFKGAALVLYIFGGLFGGGANFITVTVINILLLSADFWVVKNITGRLLVGLRWWNKVDGDSTRWIFESAGDTQVVNKFDSRVFWTVLYATPVIWMGLAVIGLLKLELRWLLTVFMALALSGANVYGYYKCSSDQKAKFQQMMQQGAQAGAMSMLRGGLFGVLAGQPSQNQNSNTTATSTYA